MKMRVTKIKFLLCLITLVPGLSEAVYGGSKADQEMQKSLVYLIGTHSVCSAALITKNIVLTAAHCRDTPGRFEKVVLVTPEGEDGRECNTSKVVDYAYAPGAERIFPDRIHAPDIVMLKLESELCSGQPAELSSETLSPGDQLDLIGYGGGSGAWHKARQISLEIVPTEEAMSLNTSEKEDFKELLRLSPEYYNYAKPLVKNTTACGGDSGGPLFSNENCMNLLAITGAVFPNKDLGAEKCYNGYLHLITPIAPHYDWIVSQIAIWSADLLYASSEI